MKMLFKEWLNFEFPKHEIIFDASGYGLLKILGPSTQYGDPPVTYPVGISRYIKSFVEDYTLDYNIVNVSDKLCYLCTTCYHDNEKNTRAICYQNTQNLPFVTFHKNNKTPKDYSLELLQHKFCISPEGTGEDCHRHYEAIYFKSIPIINKPYDEYCLKKWGLPSRIKNKYHDLPVLYTNDYSELTPEYLNLKYEEILNTTYNFDKLTKTYWKYNSFLLSIQCQRILDVQNRTPEFNLEDI